MEKIKSSQGDYIQGRFVPVEDANGELESRNPADLDAPSIPFPFAYERVGEVVGAARSAFLSWKRMPFSDRLSILQKYRKVLVERRTEIEFTLSWEIGKPLWESKQEFSTMLTMLDDVLACRAEPFAPQQVEIEEDCTGVVRRFPRGVAVVISPSVMPLIIPHSHFLPALVMGNTVVLKSSKHSPGVGQLIAEAFHDAGIPAGVFNVIHGDSELSRRLVSHSDVDTVFFTGSSEAGSKIAKQVAPDYWKLAVLDLGGKNTVVVWDDCHYQKALHDAALSAFITSGQRCTSTDRILVHEKIFDRFVNDLHQIAKKIKVGYALSDGPDTPFLGPLVSEAALEHYLRTQGMAVREGCEEIMRGKTLERDKRGYFVSPSIHWVTKPDPKSMYQKTEVFGPDAAIYKVGDLSETAEIINLSPFGMVATVYTAARENYARLLEESRVGLFHWNRPTTDVSYRLPYGGVKRSSNARPMGSLAAQQCTVVQSSLEHTGSASLSHLPHQLPKLEG